jgi:hypothetical protein
MKDILAVVVALAAVAQSPTAEPPTCSLSGLVKEAATYVTLEGVRVWTGQPDDDCAPIRLPNPPVLE